MDYEGDSIVEISGWMNGDEEEEKVRGKHQKIKSEFNGTQLLAHIPDPRHA